ncbi:unnamed protein product [Clonostachys rosea]|uniref:Prolyl 4-hydroxylase alpha subunit Fe(2+) 2OG dioxygenase domain-containing protein n=1 Tax=Bionectria ochroleuca TaxID=29856 RepID=A0ABY6U4S1_BIOOC|nr:unnamed protein product [Clonostachys rosea]
MAPGANTDPSRTQEEKEAKEQLAHALEQLEISFSYAAFEEIKDALPIGLTVFGVGDLDMPLNEDDLHRVIALSRPRRGNSRQARLGTCNAWELDPEQFAFLDPVWDGHLYGLAHGAARKLGILSVDSALRIEAQLDKMLICGEGAIPDRSLSTNKSPNTFATMAIFLPSTYQGGEIDVRFGTGVQSFEPSKHDQSICCWFSDVKHDLRPISSGYSCVLLYNLTTKEGFGAPYPYDFSTAGHAIGEALALWANLDCSKRQGNFLLHPLRHDYCQPSLSPEGLKPVDLAITQQLIEAASELPVEVLFAHPERNDPTI